MTRESSASLVLPVSDESVAAAAPNSLARILREWPDAAARAAIVAVACTLFWLTWAHWGSFQIDCGRELYIPVQILHGKLLYRDLWFPHGPLASYIEALLVGLFGQHFYVFYLFGLFMAVACALLSFQIGVMLEERAAGLAAALVLLFQGFEPSLFNYIFPYAYTAPLGLLLGLICVCFAIRDVLGLTSHGLIVAGLAAGMAILCKQEIGVACYVVLAFVLVAEAAIQSSARPLFRGILECAPGVALWIAVYGWFFWKLTPAFILFDNWQFFPGSYFMKTVGVAYAAAVGLRFVPSELIILILDAVVAVFLWNQIARLSYKYVGRWPFIATTLVLAAGMALVHHSALARDVMAPVWTMLVFPPGMFFIGCGFLASTLYRLYKHPKERRLLAEATLGVFALMLSLRIMAQIRPIGYGIYYDIPLFFVYIVTINRYIQIAGPILSVENRRTLVNSLLAVEVAMLAIYLNPLGNDRTARLETSWGAIYLKPSEASVARKIIDFISAQKQKARRVVVIPEGHMIYALTGTEAPSRWETIIPGVLSPPQEEDYIADLRRADADYILLTNRKTSEYGKPYFGIDYDRKIYGWILANYRVVREFGRFRRDGSQGWAALLFEHRGQHVTGG